MAWPAFLWAAVVAVALGLFSTICAADAQAPRYKSGGIGQADVASMKQESTEYSTTLTFANKVGEYLADVSVTIRDAAGKPVLDAVSEGPLLLVDLPPGRYQVEAKHHGRLARRDIIVPAQGHVRAVVQP